MNPKVTLGLVIFLVVLGGYVYFFEVDPDKTDELDPDSSSVQIYGTEYGEYDIVELEIVTPQGTAHFARTNETLTQDWQMLAPTPLRPDDVDQVRVNGAATRMARLTASQVITHVANLAQYGLDPPELTVTLTISNGQKIVLYTGNETPVAGSRYIRAAEDDQTVYLVSGFAVDDLRHLIEEPPLEPTSNVAPTESWPPTF